VELVPLLQYYSSLKPVAVLVYEIWGNGSSERILVGTLGDGSLPAGFGGKTTVWRRSPPEVEAKF